ncbi:1-aminocyclopropane-1-carboxylate deaminase [Helicobacter cinaedi]|uniref:1-aminocyclopropane-1-carboxylate deaminase n=1 Tax=Helicobacter cinaedi TaxID=213 RepID=UPI001F2B42F7|nr:1-aminocyclopropane-1-carboxylate deaminase [Helicobacter cinaedi]BDB66881.1 1-aminocyclopropane-1-carboxylate deaminase [Helicobacter cinaedi]
MNLDFSRSFVEQREIFNRRFWIKRDDCIHTYCNGNKARKFFSLLDSTHKVWTSYGGNQSNAMLTLAYLASIKGVAFHYVMPSFYGEPIGNLKMALSFGMTPHILPFGLSVVKLESYAKTLSYENALFIPQGGSVNLAQKGMNALAKELSQSVGGSPVLFYTSGSGVGVVALKKALDSYFPNASLVVLACAKGDLEQKFLAHSLTPPLILQAPFAFAKPKREIWQMREYLKSKGLVCDLIYDSVGFCIIEKYLEKFQGREFVFIHSGGLLGDISQEQRYKPCHRF